MSGKNLLARLKRQTAELKDIHAHARQRRQWLKARHRDSPPFRQAVAADVAMTLTYRGEMRDRGPLSRTQIVAEAARLTWSTDAFAAQLIYRGRVALMRRGVPLAPRVCHLLSMASSQVCIGDPVIVGAGMYLPHGQVVVDGVTEIGSGVLLFPWTTVGLRSGNFIGPRVGDESHIFTGAKVLGDIEVGARTRVGANAVLISDTGPDSTVVGVPAQPVPTPTRGA